MSFEWQGDYLELYEHSDPIRVYGLDPTRSLVIDVVSARDEGYKNFTVGSFPNDYGKLEDCPLTLPPLQEFIIYGGIEGVSSASVTLSLVYAANMTPIVPAAISSELDDTGEERIHVANKIVSAPSSGCAVASGWSAWDWGGSEMLKVYADTDGPGVQNAPDWLATYDEATLYIDFYDDGNMLLYNRDTGPYFYRAPGQESPGGGSSGRGTIYNADMSKSVCFTWDIPGGS